MNTRLSVHSNFLSEQVGYRGNSDYRGIVTGISSRATSNTRGQRSQKDEKSDRDCNASRDLNVSHERDSCRVSDLRDKIRKSFLTTRGSQDMIDNSMLSKLNDSSTISKPRQERESYSSKIKERPEMNTTITSLKQSIELLKYSKMQNDKVKNARLQESYDKLNNSFAGKIRNQSDKFTGSFLKQLEGEEETKQKRTEGIVSKIVAEKMRTMEKKFQERRQSNDRSSFYDRSEKSVEREREKSPYVMA